MSPWVESGAFKDTFDENFNKSLGRAADEKQKKPEELEDEDEAKPAVKPSE